MLQPWIVGDALGQVRTIRQLRIYGPSRGGTERCGSEALALVQGVLHALRKRLVA